MRLESYPIVMQSEQHDCGRAVVRSVFQWWELPIPRTFPCTPIDGTHPRAIEDVLRTGNKLAVVAGSMTVGMLMSNIREGIPTIVLGQHATGEGHYSVVVEYLYRTKKQGGEAICTMDPSTGYTLTPVAEFVDRWHDRGRDGVNYHQFGIAAWLM